MRTRPPELADEDVRDAIRAGWGIDAAGATYLPVGFGSHHWRAGTWFVTVDDLDVRRFAPDEPRSRTFARLDAALTTARSLAAAGHAFVAAPIPATDGNVLRRLRERWSIAVHPLLQVDPGAAPDRRTLLEAIVAVHGAGPELLARAERETFAIQARADLEAALADLAPRWRSGPYAERLRAALALGAGAIRRALARHDDAAALAARHWEQFVLTHGEPHHGNVLMTPDGLRLIDWDTALVAPPERDLWILGEGDPDAIRDYEAATDRAVDPILLEYYRRTWQLTDVATFTATIRRPHADTDDARKALDDLRESLDQLSR
jgi:spectinomycin phosphotransferase/16S rRNA (guanine(1405)-N(7))-methyltransferase